jgi:hypothetical protein
MGKNWIVWESGTHSYFQSKKVRARINVAFLTQEHNMT